MSSATRFPSFDDADPIVSLHCSNVVWAADTNYRINLTNDEARTFAEQDDYDSLFAADQVSSIWIQVHPLLLSSLGPANVQLSLAMRSRGVFKGYHEAPIVFRPTYKFVHVAWLVS